MLADDDPRIVPLIHEGAALARTDPARLEDDHIAAAAVYDRASADALQRRREAAREIAIRKAWDAERAAARALTTAAAPARLTAPELDAIVGAMASELPAMIARRLDPILARIAALESRHTCADHHCSGSAVPSRAENRSGASDVIDTAIVTLAPAIAAIITARCDHEEAALLARGGDLADYDDLRTAFAEAEGAAYAQLHVVLEAAAAVR